jgi:hypothetical protein
MGLFFKRLPAPLLNRQRSLAARPVLNDLITCEHTGDGHLVLHLPRRRTGMVRAVARAFKLPPSKQVELDELGSYTVQLCDGSHSVAEIVRLFARKFRLHRREAELSMVSFLQTLARRGIISFAVPKDSQQ